jgi:hypothetical protein
MRLKIVALAALVLFCGGLAMAVPSAQASGLQGSCHLVHGDIDASLTGIPDPTVSGTVTGGLAGAVTATVHSQTDSGGIITLDLSHQFTTGAGAIASGVLNTKDVGTWTPIAGQDNMVRMFTTYVVDGGEGAFAGAGGVLVNFGTVNLDTGVFDLSYGGVVCY